MAKNTTNKPVGPLILGMTAPRMTDKITPFIVERGEGVHVYDADGKKYLDSQGGLWCVNVGHNHPKMNKAIIDQLNKIACYNGFVDTSHIPSIELGQKIIDMTAEENMRKVMFSSGGSDAVETAMKLARQYWKLEGKATRTKFISMQYAYHGVHFGGVSINGNSYYREPYEPLLPGCYQIPAPFVYRNPWTEDPQELGELCAGFLEAEILKQGAETVAAFVCEPIQGAGGVVVPPENFWPRVREVCDKYGVLLIADEIVTGFGRSGALFGSRGWGVKPDIMCFAKGISSGYVPLGATVINERVAKAWEVDGPEGMIMHGYTYMGHALACAAGLQSLKIVEEEGLVENAGKVGAYYIEQMTALKDEFPIIGDVRGKGLMMAVELVADRKTKEPLAPDNPLTGAISSNALRNGVVIRGIANKLIASPPLTFSRENVDEVVSVLRKAFKEECA